MFSWTVRPADRPGMMGRLSLRIGLILILFFLLGCPQKIQAIPYQTIMEGLEYASHPTSKPEVKLHLLRVDLKKLRVKPMDARKFEQETMAIKTLVTKSGAIAGINANFFDEHNRPLGLLIMDGKMRSKPRQVKWWSALLIKGDKATIRKAFNVDDIKDYDSGIQAGPRLVINGEIPALKKEMSPKSAIGIDSKGRLIFIGSEGSIGIDELANILARPENKGGVGLRDALNLDGGSSAQMYVKAGKFELSLPGRVRIPVGLGVFEK